LKDWGTRARKERLRAHQGKETQQDNVSWPTYGTGVLYSTIEVMQRYKWIKNRAYRGQWTGGTCYGFWAGNGMERWSWRSVNVQVGQVEDVELHQSGQRWKGRRERRLAQPREVFKGKTRRGELMKKRISVVDDSLLRQARKLN
jgi:hypothetical protein